MEVMDLMKQTDKESFIGTLDLWYEKWKDFLNERTINPQTNKSFYTHKRLRSAYRSLKTNLPWLFTWYDYIELGIPTLETLIRAYLLGLMDNLG